MKALEKLFLKLLEKCLEVTTGGCFAGLTSLADICHRFLDHLLWNCAPDVLDSFFEFVPSFLRRTCIMVYAQKK